MEEPPEIKSPVDQAGLYRIYWQQGFKEGVCVGLAVGLLVGALALYFVTHQIEFKRLHPKAETVYSQHAEHDQ